ncbi:hypothetical protein Agub_g613 [Astrephomene gubernaculifera]|uniref:Uncharacterized protein n=1 Tax=Astrephomene gubernaculifera TaxID=47775 RepID=A0AAD3HH11_9CHLO|nr:hypothetical protein Agub_g613 [Astrephomene gubernaculifera]
MASYFPRADEFVLDFDAEEQAQLQILALAAGQPLLTIAGAAAGPGAPAATVAAAAKRGLKPAAGAASTNRGTAQTRNGGPGPNNALAGRGNTSAAAPPGRIDSELDALRREIARLEQLKKQGASKPAPAAQPGQAAARQQPASGRVAARKTQQVPALSSSSGAAAAGSAPAGEAQVPLAKSPTARAGARAVPAGAAPSGTGAHAAKRARLQPGNKPTDTAQAAQASTGVARSATAGNATGASAPPDTAVSSAATPASSEQGAAAAAPAEGTARAEQLAGTKRGADAEAVGPGAQQLQQQRQHLANRQQPRSQQPPSADADAGPGSTAQEASEGPREGGAGGDGSDAAEGVAARGPLQLPGTVGPGGSAQPPDQAGPGPPAKRPRRALAPAGSGGSGGGASSGVGVMASGHGLGDQAGGAEQLQQRAAGPATHSGPAVVGTSGRDAGRQDADGEVVVRQRGQALAAETISPEAEQAANAFLMSLLTQMGGGAAGSQHAAPQQAPMPLPPLERQQPGLVGVGLGGGQHDGERPREEPTAPGSQEPGALLRDVQQPLSGPSGQGRHAGGAGSWDRDAAAGPTERATRGHGAQGTAGMSSARRAAAERTTAAVQRMRRKSAVAAATPVAAAAAGPGRPNNSPADGPCTMAAGPHTAAHPEAGNGVLVGSCPNLVDDPPHSEQVLPVMRADGGCDACAAAESAMPLPASAGLLPDIISRLPLESRTALAEALAPVHTAQTLPQIPTAATDAAVTEPDTTPRSGEGGTLGPPAEQPLRAMPNGPVGHVAALAAAACQPGMLVPPPLEHQHVGVRDPDVLLGAVGSPVGAPPQPPLSAATTPSRLPYDSAAAVAAAVADMPAPPNLAARMPPPGGLPAEFPAHPWVQGSTAGRGSAPAEPAPLPAMPAGALLQQQQHEVRPPPHPGPGLGAPSGPDYGCAGAPNGFPAAPLRGGAVAGSAGEHAGATAAAPASLPLPQGGLPPPPVAPPGLAHGAFPPLARPPPGLQPPHPYLHPPAYPMHPLPPPHFPGAFPLGPPAGLVPGWRPGLMGPGPGSGLVPLAGGCAAIPVEEVDLLARKELLLLKWRMLQELAADVQGEWRDVCMAHNRLRTQLRPLPQPPQQPPLRPPDQPTSAAAASGGGLAPGAVQSPAAPCPTLSHPLQHHPAAQQPLQGGQQYPHPVPPPRLPDQPMLPPAGPAQLLPGHPPHAGQPHPHGAYPPQLHPQPLSLPHQPLSGGSLLGAAAGAGCAAPPASAPAMLAPPAAPVAPACGPQADGSRTAASGVQHGASYERAEVDPILQNQQQQAQQRQPPLPLQPQQQQGQQLTDRQVQHHRLFACLEHPPAQLQPLQHPLQQIQHQQQPPGQVMCPEQDAPMQQQGQYGAPLGHPQQQYQGGVFPAVVEHGAAAFLAPCLQEHRATHQQQPQVVNLGGGGGNRPAGIDTFRHLPEGPHGQQQQQQPSASAGQPGSGPAPGMGGAVPSRHGGVVQHGCSQADVLLADNTLPRWEHQGQPGGQPPQQQPQPAHLAAAAVLGHPGQAAAAGADAARLVVAAGAQGGLGRWSSRFSLRRYGG